MSIIVGFADTEEGAAAAAAGLHEASLRGTQLVIVPLAADAAASTTLAGIKQQAATDGVDIEVCEAPEGDKTDHLLSIAQDRRALLIVIGLRRRTNVGKLILGSNAQRIMLDASCPVLTVKPLGGAGE